MIKNHRKGFIYGQYPADEEFCVWITMIKKKITHCTKILLKPSSCFTNPDDINTLKYQDMKLAYFSPSCFTKQTDKLYQLQLGL